MQRNAAVGNLKCSAVETIGNDGDVPIIKPGKPGPDFFGVSEVCFSPQSTK